MENYSNCKVLIAEDLDSNYTFLEILLKKLGFKDIRRAYNGKEAVEMFTPDLDLILMDLRMPVMDGYQAIDEIRKVNTEVPIIVQSAYILPEHPEKLLKTKCNAYIGKPIDIIELRKLIDKFLTN